MTDTETQNFIVKDSNLSIPDSLQKLRLFLVARTIQVRITKIIQRL